MSAAKAKDTPRVEVVGAVRGGLWKCACGASATEVDKGAAWLALDSHRCSKHGDRPMGVVFRGAQQSDDRPKEA